VPPGLKRRRGGRHKKSAVSADRRFFAASSGSECFFHGRSTSFVFPSSYHATADYQGKTRPACPAKKKFGGAKILLDGARILC